MPRGRSQRVKSKPPRKSVKKRAIAETPYVELPETISDLDYSDRGAAPSSRLEELIASGLAQPAKHDIRDLPAPKSGPSLSAALAELRNEERY